MSNVVKVCFYIELVGMIIENGGKYHLNQNKSIVFSGFVVSTL